MASIQTRSQLMDEMFGLLQTTWDANADGATLIYDNMEGQRPTDPEIWGRATIQHGFGNVTTINAPGSNARVNRRRGDMYVQIFAPAGSGTFEIGALADALASAYESVPVSFPVRITDTNVNEIGVDDAGAYYQLNLVVGFSYDRVS